MKRRAKIRKLPPGDIGTLFEREARKAARAETHKERNRLRSLWAKITRDEEQATSRYLESLRAAMQNELQQAWLKQKLAEAEARGRELARELNRDILKSEREELLKRGIVRGLRRKNSLSTR